MAVGQRLQRDAPRWATAALLGCFTAASLAMLALIALSLGVPRVVDSMVEAYTDPESASVAAPSLSEPEEEELRERIEAFGVAVDEGTETGPLVLSEDELNALLSGISGDEAFDSGLSVELVEGGVRAHISLPLKQSLSLGPWSRDLTGRYINGVAMFNVYLEAGELDLYLASFEVKGKRVPRWLLDRVRQAIDESGFFEHEDIRETVSNLRDLDVLDGQIVATAKEHPRRR